MESWRRNRRRFLGLAAAWAAGTAAAYSVYKWWYAVGAAAGEEDPSASGSRLEGGVLLDSHGPAGTAQMDAEAHLQHHFESIQEIADGTTLPSLLPTLSRALMQAADVETPLERLRRAKQGSVPLAQGDKLAAWEELKVAAFSRALGSAWLLPLLDLFVRVQLNILGRHLYLESAVEGSGTQRPPEVPKLSAPSQERFLSYAEFLAQQGAAELLSVLRRVATAQLAEVSLAEALSAAQVQQLMAAITEEFTRQMPATLGGRRWARLLLPEPASLSESLAPRAPDDRAVLLGADAMLVDGHVVEQLAAEAEAVAGSSEFAETLQVCAAEVLKTASSRLTGAMGEQPLPLAKVVPLLAALGGDLLAPSLRPALARLETARSLSARVYGCYFCADVLRLAGGPVRRPWQQAPLGCRPHVRPWLSSLLIAIAADETSTRAAERAGDISAAAATAGGGTGTGTGTPRKWLSFEERYRQLELFHQEHSHTRVPVQEPSGLGMWAARQRHSWKAGRLAPSRQRQLAALGFSPDVFQDAWATQFRQLATFHSEYGHCRVPRAPWAQQRYPGLHRWLQQQLRQWQEGTLEDGRRRRLEGMGVPFQPHECGWEARYADLLDFREAFGHVDVPFQWPPNPGLACWVMTQRARWRGDLGTPLSPSQHSRLLSCGFDFSPMKGRWDRRYAQLCELQQQRGGSLLSKPLPADNGLAAWTAFQLRQWRRGRLAPDCVAKLEALGLMRTSMEQQRGQRWQRRLAALDALVGCLGLPAAYALLVLAPASTAAAMAAEAVSRAGGDVSLGQDGSSSSASSGSVAAAAPGRGLSSADAAAVVRWYRGLAVRRLPSSLAQALEERSLPGGARCG